MHHLIDFAKLILRPLYWLAGKLFSIWARPLVQPETPTELYADAGDKPVCYVLESGGLADLLALEQACDKHGLPSPSESFEFCGEHFSRRFVVLRPTSGFIFRRPVPGRTLWISDRRKAPAAATGDLGWGWWLLALLFAAAALVVAWKVLVGP